MSFLTLGNALSFLLGNRLINCPRFSELFLSPLSGGPCRSAPSLFELFLCRWWYNLAPMRNQSRRSRLPRIAWLARGSNLPTCFFFSRLFCVWRWWDAVTGRLRLFVAGPGSPSRKCETWKWSCHLGWTPRWSVHAFFFLLSPPLFLRHWCTIALLVYWEARGFLCFSVQTWLKTFAANDDSTKALFVEKIESFCKKT